MTCYFYAYAHHFAKSLYFLKQSGNNFVLFMVEQSTVKKPTILKSKAGKGWTIHLKAPSLSLDFEYDAVSWTLWLEIVSSADGDYVTLS